MSQPPRIPLALLSLVLGTSGGCGSHPSAQAQETVEPDYSDQIGQYVTQTFEDRDGNLWFGTLNRGAARFDGRSLRYFTHEDGLSEGPVSAITQDAEGLMWFGTHGGVSSYDGESFTIRGPADGILGRGGSVRTDRDGKVWVSTSAGIFRRQGEGFVAFPLPEPTEKVEVYAIRGGDAFMVLQDSKGNLWFATDGRGAFKYDGETFTQYTKADGLCSDCVNDILEDSRGRIWFICMQAYQPVMTHDGGLCRLDGDKFVTFPETPGLKGADLYSLYQDRHGNVWVGATGHGAQRYDGETFTLFDDYERTDLVWSLGTTGILQDRHGRMWFGMSGGLFRLEGEKMINVTKDGPWE